MTSFVVIIFIACLKLGGNQLVLTVRNGKITSFVVIDLTVYLKLGIIIILFLG